MSGAKGPLDERANGRALQFLCVLFSHRGAPGFRASVEEEQGEASELWPLRLQASGGQHLGLSSQNTL